MSAAPRSQGRELRVADFIRETLAEIIRARMRDPRVGLVSVTDARVSRDLSYADVYVTSLDANDAEARATLLEVLNGAAGYLRSSLAKRHGMRTTPRLRFHYDELIESGPRLDALIEKAVADDRRAEDRRNRTEDDVDGDRDGA